MKPAKLFLITIIGFMLASCKSDKKETTNTLYGTTWEMEYITGPRIAFEGLYPDKKPQLTFNDQLGKVEGHNSCNGYSADFKLDGESIFFGDPGPTTMMYCGEGEKVFLNMLKKVNKFGFDEEGNLELLADEVPMMRFHKIDPSQVQEVVAETPKASTLEIGCYAYNNGDNHVMMKVTEMSGNTVSGNLKIAYAEKDASEGAFKGTLSDNKLFITYTFTSEGTQSSRAMAYQLQGNQLVEGYGALNEDGTMFADSTALEYSSKMPLAKVDCN